jgi:hypothetical protein
MLAASAVGQNARRQAAAGAHAEAIPGAGRQSKDGPTALGGVGLPSPRHLGQALVRSLPVYNEIRSTGLLGWRALVDCRHGFKPALRRGPRDRFVLRLRD